MQERLEKIADYYNLNKSSFANKIGIPSQTLGNYFNGREPDVKTIRLIIETFVDINAEWLITGKGEMLKKEGKEFSPDVIDIIKQQSQTINSQQKTIEELIKKIQGDIAGSA